jgi:hypothetical protein
LQKFNQLVYSLSKCPLKNPDPGSLCKKWGVRVSHVEKPPVLAKKTFFATTRVVPFFSGNSKGNYIYICTMSRVCPRMFFSAEFVEVFPWKWCPKATQ